MRREQSTYIPYETLAEQDYIAAVVTTKRWVRQHVPRPLWPFWKAWEAEKMRPSIERTCERMADYRGHWHHVLLLSRALVNPNGPSLLAHSDMELIFRLEQAPIVLLEYARVRRPPPPSRAARRSRRSSRP